jgi:hypothetical protein
VRWTGKEATQLEVVGALAHPRVPQVACPRRVIATRWIRAWGGVREVAASRAASAAALRGLERAPPDLGLGREK